VDDVRFSRIEPNELRAWNLRRSEYKTQYHIPSNDRITTFSWGHFGLLKTWSVYSKFSLSLVQKYIILLYVSTRNVGQCPTNGRPAEYRWRPLFNGAKFGWRRLLECCAVTLPRRETRWNLQGCPKLTKRSQPLVGRSSPYYGDMWKRYWCLTSFFSDCQCIS